MNDNDYKKGIEYINNELNNKMDKQYETSVRRYPGTLIPLFNKVKRPYTKFKRAQDMVNYNNEQRDNKRQIILNKLDEQEKRRRANMPDIPPPGNKALNMKPANTNDINADDNRQNDLNSIWHKYFIKYFKKGRHKDFKNKASRISKKRKEVLREKNEFKWNERSYGINDSPPKIGGNRTRRKKSRRKKSRKRHNSNKHKSNRRRTNRHRTNRRKKRKYTHKR